MKFSALLLAAFGLSIQVTMTAKPLNVLFIFSDDHAYQAISAYGSNRNKTPNIDRLAKEGMIFHRAFVTNSIWRPQPGRHSHGQAQSPKRSTDQRHAF